MCVCVCVCVCVCGCEPVVDVAEPATLRGVVGACGAVMQWRAALDLCPVDTAAAADKAAVGTVANQACQVPPGWLHVQQNLRLCAE